MWSNPAEIFPRLSPHFIFWADDHGAYLQSLDSLVSRDLNAQALEILKQCNGRTSANEIIARIASLYADATLDRVRKDVCSFLDTMVREGFLIPDRNMKNPESVSPSLVYVSLTEKCNLRCAFCYGQGLEPVEELCENDWLYLLSKVSGFVPRGSTLVFTGGEPTLYGSFESIARAAREYGFRLQMYSNGTLFDEKLTNLCAGLGFDLIGISIH
ncbi:MAG: radical SAM protein, partial [Desulfobacteraceae bacterium]